MLIFFKALFLIFIAELGDKTQLLVISLASKYKPAVVLLGIFCSTLILFLLASLIGTVIGDFIPLKYIKVIVSIAFIAFGVWTLLEKDEVEKSRSIGKFGPFLTIALFFFAAEMGDKTQLATLSLASESRNHILQVWLGATVGMVIADGLAVFVGAILHKKVSKKLIRIIAGIIFITYGIFNFFLH